LPCVVIGYHLTAGRLRDLVMASLVAGKLAYVGTVELVLADGTLGQA